MKIHYCISPNEAVALCGRFANRITMKVNPPSVRRRALVTCKDCLKELANPNYSAAQFVGSEVIAAGYTPDKRDQT